ncbi:MAG: phosphatidyl-myo-inositol alpha-mannosyltransferase, partial [Solirubrobacteraceae bacterium]|nr:phosphatidyl-myo-inositol alpha-mannosyltransferase [Solirubrobacteraceae bacterium]
MRIALVSPYSWSYPGGVNQHVAALGSEFRELGHEVRTMAPFDGTPDELPEDFISLGATISVPFNGAVSHVAMRPHTAFAVRRELREGGFDVVHVHEPVAAHACRQAIGVGAAPTVGTFHTYSESILLHGIATLVGTRLLTDRLHARIAVSEAAEWTGRRFYGGRYRVIPNGVIVPEPATPAYEPERPFEILFVGQAVERKGLPILLQAFDALRDRVPARLRIIGPEPSELEAVLPDDFECDVLGRVDDATKERLLREADVLCAPSLGGESFGMVLTEAFAAGTPVVASDIPGYREVVTHGETGMLVPPGDALMLAQALLELACDRPRVREMGTAARAAAPAFAWPHVADQVLETYEEAIEVAQAETGRFEAFARRRGLRPADGLPQIRAQLIPSLQPERPRQSPRRALGVGVAVAGMGVAAYESVQRIDWTKVGKSVVDSSPSWVLLAVALMCVSMVARAVSWQAIIRAALPTRPSRFRDVLRATSVGVLMSATIPGRVGEALRVFVLARRLGPTRQTAPPVAGTVVTQTVFNLLALAILGTITFHTVGIFGGRQKALVAYAVVPVVLILAVAVVPSLLRARGTGALRVWSVRTRALLVEVRRGLTVFRRPRLAGVSVFAQLTAWALQWAACVALLESLHLVHAGVAAPAAAVLFAVNVSAVIPVTPSNVGVFQAACV